MNLIHQHTMKCTVHMKQKLTYFVTGYFYVVGGIEFAVVLPTLWSYLETYFDSQPYMLGVVMSSFSVGSIVSGPLYGFLSDKTGNTKVIILIANIFSIVGNCMYSLGISDWFLATSRLIAGFGFGVITAIAGDIARTTPVKTRTRVISAFLAMIQFGILSGPACNVFLKEVDFYVGPVHIDRNTVPGVFLAALWLIFEILVIFIYWNLQALQEEIEHLNHETDQDYFENDQNETDFNHGQESSALLLNEVKDFVITDSEDDNFQIADTKFNLSSGQSSDDESVDNTRKVNLTWKYVYEEFIREEVVVVLASYFNAFFGQYVIETALTPLTKYYLEWDEMQISLLFFVASVEVLFVYFFIMWLSKYVSDRYLLLFSNVLLIIVMVLNLYFFSTAKRGQNTRNLVWLLVTAFLDLIAIPIIALSSASLFTKITRPETQGFAQGVRRIFFGMAMILGPLWCSGLLPNQLVIMWGVCLALGVLFTLLMVLSFKRLKVPETKKQFNELKKESDSSADP